MKSEKNLLFHGSRAQFSVFDPQFANSGEGSRFDGWYFIDSLKGAYYHAESRLRHIAKPGLVYVCLIPDSCVVQNIEWTDTHYHGSTVGVRFFDSLNIEIVEVLETRLLFDEVAGPAKSYILETQKRPLEGGCVSYLRRTPAIEDGQ